MRLADAGGTAVVWLGPRTGIAQRGPSDQVREKFDTVVLAGVAAEREGEAGIGCGGASQLHHAGVPDRIQAGDAEGPVAIAVFGGAGSHALAIGLAVFEQALAFGEAGLVAVAGLDHGLALGVQPEPQRRFRAPKAAPNKSRPLS